MMLEKDIEKAVCHYASKQNWLVYKFSSPAHASVPDRMFIRNGRVFFVEFKRPGQRATAKQLREIRRLLNQGIPTYVCDDIEMGQEIIDYQSEGRPSADTW